MSKLLNPQLATRLSDARRQVHHAAQLAKAAGVSYLPHRADDSHTNLEWLDAGGMLASNLVPAGTPFRVAVGVADLSLAVLDSSNVALAEFPLDGRTIADGAAWIRVQFAALGAPAERYTLKRHYPIPHHPVDGGAAFDTTDAAAFEQLAAWFAIASDALERVRAQNQGASEVRCWPHHFDIATLIEVAPGKTIGAGMEPGDVYYDEPYFYLNVSPQPAEIPVTPLASGVTWHTHQWIGAVLPGSRLVSATAREDIGAFLDSALSACRAMLDATGSDPLSPSSNSPAFR